ncbi:MAG: hypothetical protein IJO06_13485, partial [Thermoguttaceae bacterium]|nr:hypothetical protein [Thermoguttaceae bacterium]
MNRRFDVMETLGLNRRTRDGGASRKSGPKSNGKASRPKREKTRLARLEQLEERALLAVSASEFAAIRAAHPAFNLPESASELNVIEIAASELSVASLKSAIATSGTTQAPDLIVLRTTDDAHTLTFESAADEIKLAFDSTKYGALTIVGFGTRPLTIDAAGQSRAASLTSGVANLGSITIEGGKESETGAGVNATGGTLTLSNATLNSKINITNRTTLTQVTLNAPTTISSQNAQFDAVTVNAPITVSGGGSKLTIVNDLELNSLLTLSAYGHNSYNIDHKPRVVFSGSQTLTGGGSIVFSADTIDSCNAYVDIVGTTESPAVLTVADTLTFESVNAKVRGHITGTNGSLIYGGTLKSTSGALYLEATTAVRAGGALKVEATSGATVCVASAVSGEQLSFSGAGTTRLSGSYSDGELILVGSGLRRFSGSLDAVTISGASDVSPLTADSSWARFDAVTVNAPVAVSGGDSKLT